MIALNVARDTFSDGCLFRPEPDAPRSKTVAELFADSERAFQLEIEGALDDIRQYEARLVELELHRAIQLGAFLVCALVCLWAIVCAYANGL